MSSSNGSQKNEQSIVPIFIVTLIFALLTIFILWMGKLDLWLGVTAFVSIALTIVLQGMRQLPASPPHRGVPTLFGHEIQGWVLGSGWTCLPLYPFWFGVILVKIEPVNIKVDPISVRTPKDRASVEVFVELTFTPADMPGLLYSYVKAGGEENVIDILLGRIQERVRQWIRSPKEGPQTWEAAMDATDEATGTLLKQIAEDDILPIPSEIPTSILFRLLFEDGKPLTDEEKVKWIPIWNGYTNEKRGEVHTACEQRKNTVREIMGGRAELPIKSLGIFLNRLNVTEIRPLGKVAEAAELQEKERLEREAEVLEIDHVAERLQKLMTLHPKGPGLTRDQALEVIQTERGKATKTIFDLGASTQAVARNLGLDRIFKGRR